MTREKPVWCDACKACAKSVFQKGDRTLCVRCVFEELREDERDADRYRWLAQKSPGTIAAIAYRFSAACHYGPSRVNESVDAAMR